MKTDLISVITLVYNTEDYVKKCLNSILKQTYDNLEIIAINDGSIDKSSKIIEKLAETDKRIKIINRENKGRYLSRLEGYKLAKGKYIIYIDSDDWINKDMIELMYKNIKETKADVVRCQYKKFENDSITVPKNILNRNVLMDVEHLEPQFFDLLYKTNYCNTICKQLMKRSVMKDINKIEEDLDYCEDLACNLKIYKNMKSILFMPDELYVYNTEHSYKNNILTKDDVNKKIQDTIYVYYNLYLSTKEFEIKNKKEYRKFAAMRMIEKLSILLCSLIKITYKKEFAHYFNSILEDDKVKEILKELENENIESICLDIKHMSKRDIKNCEYLISRKINQFYSYNSIILNPFKLIKKN